MSSLYLKFAVLLVCGIAGSQALKCYFQTEGPEEGSSKEASKEYECAPRDKYCVDFGGTLRNPVKNVTLALRSCEGDVKRYLDPISSKIGEKIDFECASADGKKKDIGPLTYWYNCCTTDDCNNAAISSFNMVLLFQLVTSCVLLSTFFSIAA
uniref:UPAR/Ly6 domain-containing protein n=1 Tax=Ditylenchus dipsaci TaxID=166011 RepID=A0A915ENR7_9BILA